MWTSLGTTLENTAPSSRTKHSATLLGDHVYVFGGRNGNLPLKDFWRYSISEGKWNLLEPTGDRPQSLQEHSAVAYKDCIYVFGGEIGFSAGTETPLWIYSTKENSWKKIRGQKGVLTPKGRRGHSAVVYKNSMIIYGGYEDLRGSSNELWIYHFESESWHLISSKSSSASTQKPSGRHKHSAVLHDDAMWIYGGMTDLQERGDLWRWDIVSKTWCNIKTKSNPGTLHSHAVCKLPSSMLIFGGETNGLLLNDVWRFHFGTEVWEKLHFSGNRPHPRAESIALTVSDGLIKENIKIEAIDSQSLTNSQTTQKNVSSQSISNTIQNRNKNIKCEMVEKKYVFTPNPNSYACGNLVSSAVQNSNLSFLKEISKLSSINLPRLNRKCSYSVLNSSNNDSTESLLKAREGSDSAQQTPTRMIKSQSDNFSAQSWDKNKNFSTLTPATDKTQCSIFESNEFSTAESNKSIFQDLVPNHFDFKKNQSTEGALNTDELVSLDSQQSNRKVLLDSSSSKSNKPSNFHQNPITNGCRRSLKDRNMNQINLPGTPFSSDPPKLKSNDNYNFNKKYQSDSYSSHLVSLGDSDEITEKSEGIPKSASVVRFKKQPEIADESTTSDYCSIETVNKVMSSSSNHSQCSNEVQRELLNDYPELRFPGSGYAKRERKDLDGTGCSGFSNPHYMGPDVQSILKSKDGEKTAKMLNSPPTSLLEVVRRSLEKENIELKNMASDKSKRSGLEFKLSSKQTRSPPRYLPLRGNPYNSTTVPITPTDKKKFRISSTKDKREPYNRYLQKCDNLLDGNVGSGVPFTIFLIGGKEHGQITVFKRPISLWKLRLSSNIH